MSKLDTFSTTAPRFLLVTATAVEAAATVARPWALNRSLKQQPEVSADNRRQMVMGEVLEDVAEFTVNATTMISSTLLFNRLLRRHPHHELIALAYGLIIRRLCGELLLKPSFIIALTRYWDRHVPPAYQTGVFSQTGPASPTLQDSLPIKVASPLAPVDSPSRIPTTTQLKSAVNRLSYFV